MKKKIVILQTIYYILVPCIFGAFYYLSSLLIPDNASIGSVVTAVYGILFIGSPLVIAVLMRFSLLRWYVDPFAAAEIPLLFYIIMLTSRIRHDHSFSVAFSALNRSLGSEGFFFLFGLFFFGLMASISPARKEKRNLIYILIQKP